MFTVVPVTVPATGCATTHSRLSPCTFSTRSDLERRERKKKIMLSAMRNKHDAEIQGKVVERWVSTLARIGQGHSCRR